MENVFVTFCFKGLNLVNVRLYLTLCCPCGNFVSEVGQQLGLFFFGELNKDIGSQGLADCSGFDMFLEFGEKFTMKFNYHLKIVINILFDLYLCIFLSTFYRYTVIKCLFLYFNLFFISLPHTCQRIILNCLSTTNYIHTEFNSHFTRCGFAIASNSPHCLLKSALIGSN